RFGEMRVERHVRGIAAAPQRLALAREIDDHRAHDARRIGEKMRAIAHPQTARLHEAQEALVQQYGRVEQGVASAVAQTRGGLDPQLVVRGGEELATRRLVARVGAEQQLRQLTHGVPGRASLSGYSSEYPRGRQADFSHAPILRT